MVLMANGFSYADFGQLIGNLGSGKQVFVKKVWSKTLCLTYWIAFFKAVRGIGVEKFQERHPSFQQLPFQRNQIQACENT